MKTIGRRLNKLEDRLGISRSEPRVLWFVTAAGRSPALDQDTCVQILDECGFLATSGSVMVKLLDIPIGLNARETEGFLRGHGDMICGGNRFQNRPELGASR